MAACSDSPATRRVAITGADGQLGRALAGVLGGDACPLSRSQLDITSSQDIQRALERLQPAALVNCAAFTHVDAAEQDWRTAQLVNANAVALLARHCERRDIPLVHISSDYVFGADASRETPYLETDLPGPINAYGRSKLAGEQAAATWSKHFVVRTCGLYGPSAHGRNFVETILRLAASGQSLSVVGDQHCTPSSAADVARAIAFLLSTTAYGTYHVGNTGATTWHEFAAEILRLAQSDARLQRITSREYGGTPRPAYSALDVSKFQALSGHVLRAWRPALADHLAQRALYRRAA
jgi:dTDP-4-dehydrorhamnose reductase